MKRLFLIFTLAFAVPAVAFAQQDPSGSPSPQMREQMRANFQQIETLHKEYRAQVLGALTPAHKQLYASVVGNLAIAASPDPKAAAAKLDTALSTGEKTAILNADKQFRASMKAQMEQMRAAHPWPSPSGSSRPRRSHTPRTPDAGRILLAMAGGHGGMMMRGPGMRGGPWGKPR
jgi:hypothetical protein